MNALSAAAVGVVALVWLALKTCKHDRRLGNVLLFVTGMIISMLLRAIGIFP